MIAGFLTDAKDVEVESFRYRFIYKLVRKACKPHSSFQLHAATIRALQKHVECIK